MENKQSPSKKKLLSIQEEKLIREVDYDSLVPKPAKINKKPLLLDLEIFKKNPAQRQGSQKVLVSIKPRTQPAIKTLYIAEKTRFNSKKGSSKSGSRLAIGDHSSFTTQLSKNDSNVINSIICETDCSKIIESEKGSSISTEEEESVSKYAHLNPVRTNVYNDKSRSPERCYVYTQLPLNMNLPRLEAKVDSKRSNKIDIATLIITNTSSDDTVPPIVDTISKLHKRIDYLEKKIFKQEMVFRSLDTNKALSSDEDSLDGVLKSSSGTERPGCSYIQQYSHVPETSAFQRYAHQAAPLSPSKATTIEKEHNSEQYGRDFTAYDGITARGRRQCASVPCKRDEIPKLAADRVHKIRHKLNPVRDYRLMDTVHYLAQGEFAPRDDGIKLTPSREAVLSDIIYEDVCRTHWPNTRLGRNGRAAHAERCGTRCELQRLIDSMLRERVAHVERRRRRHYRIVKLNHRHENCRTLGKTGDIIVASHKNRPGSEDAAASDLNAGSALMSDCHRDEQCRRRSNRSRDLLLSADLHHHHRSRHQDDCAGPSRAPPSREPTCCYQTSTKHITPQGSSSKHNRKGQRNQRLTSTSSGSTYRSQRRSPRLVVKKDCNRRKHRDEPNLEHYILLPTLVVRTPSNMKRQKRFNELYHRILNIQLNNGNDSGCSKPIKQTTTKKDVGFNIHIATSNSTEELNK